MPAFKRDTAARSIIETFSPQGERNAAGVVCGDWILTAAHCLPKLPDLRSSERNESVLLSIAALGNPGTRANVEVIHVDPCVDLAVLEASHEGWESYSAVMESRIRARLQLRPSSREPFTAHLRTNFGEWVSGQVNLGEAAQVFLDMKFEKPYAPPGADRNVLIRFLAGTSGSPVFDADGRVIGIVTNASVRGSEVDGVLVTRLATALPARLLLLLDECKKAAENFYPATRPARAKRRRSIRWI